MATSSNRNLIGRLAIWLVFVLLLAAIVVGAIAIATLRTKPEVQVIEIETDDNVSEETACDYVEGYTSKGIVVPSGTRVVGPAVVKPFRDKDHALVINVGVEYITTESDEVVWLLIGDNACALSNAEPFFSTYEKILNQNQ